MNAENKQTAGIAENLLRESFKDWAIEYVGQLPNGAITVKMNTHANTLSAKRILRKAGFEVTK